MACNRVGLFDSAQPKALVTLFSPFPFSAKTLFTSLPNNLKYILVPVDLSPEP